MIQEASQKRLAIELPMRQMQFSPEPLQLHFYITLRP